MRRIRLGPGLLAAAAAALGIAACGSTTVLQEAPSAGGLTTTTVGFKQSGNAAAKLDQSTVKYSLDGSGSLVVRVTLTSTARARQTVQLRASLFNQAGMIIDDATGSAITVASGVATVIELNGPAPQGTIASATFEVTSVASPTPNPATPAP